MKTPTLAQAAALPTPKPPACPAITKKGLPCPWTVEPGQALCWRHRDDPEGKAQRKEKLSAIGRKGAFRRNLNRAVGCKAALGTSKEIRSALERALERLEGSGASAMQKTHGTARLAEVAVSLLKVGDLEREVQELQQLRAELEAAKSPRAGRLYQ